MEGSEKDNAGQGGQPVEAYVPANLRADGVVAPRRDVSALLAKLTPDSPAVFPLAPSLETARHASPQLAPEPLVPVAPVTPLLAREPVPAQVSPEALVTSGGEPEAVPVKINDLLLAGLEAGASDIHVTSGAHPTVRVSGELEPMEEFPRLTSVALQQMIYAILTQKQRETFEANLELDFAYSVPGASRFRVNIYQQRESLGAAFRRIPYEIKPLEDLGVPPVVGSFANLQRGFVLVTGPTGSGKSTTLASIIDLANRTRKDHIMTVEDPIEFLHHHKGCLVNQREVGEDTKCFANALKHVLRQDPDIILVG